MNYTKVMISSSSDEFHKFYMLPDDEKEQILYFIHTICQRLLIVNYYSSYFHYNSSDALTNAMHILVGN